MFRSRIVLTSLTAVAIAACLVGVGAAFASASPGSNSPGSDSSTDSGSSPAVAQVPAAVPVRSAIMNSLYVPITPCRIMDTRQAGAGGQIGANAIRSFVVTGTVGFPAQGGKPGGCGIPTAATAVAATITPTQQSGAGWLRGWPAGGVEPTATISHYNVADTLTSGATLTLANTPGGYISIHAYDAATHLVIDVMGYYEPQMAAFVGQDGTLVSATPRVLSSTHASTGNYYVTFDSDVSLCAFFVTPYAYNYTVAVGPDFTNSNQAHVFIHDESTGKPAHDDSFFIQATC